MTCRHRQGKLTKKINVNEEDLGELEKEWKYVSFAIGDHRRGCEYAPIRGNAEFNGTSPRTLRNILLINRENSPSVYRVEQ